MQTQNRGNRQGTPNTPLAEEGRGGGRGRAVVEARELPAQCPHSHSHTNRTLDSLNNVERLPSRRGADIRRAPGLWKSMRVRTRFFNLLPAFATVVDPSPRLLTTAHKSTLERFFLFGRLAMETTVNFCRTTAEQSCCHQQHQDAATYPPVPCLVVLPPTRSGWEWVGGFG